MVVAKTVTDVMTGLLTIFGVGTLISAAAAGIILLIIGIAKKNTVLKVIGAIVIIVGIILGAFFFISGMITDGSLQNIFGGIAENAVNSTQRQM